VTNEGRVKALAKLTYLTSSLDLTDWCDKVTNEGVREMSKLTALTTLNLCGCNKVSNEGIIPFGRNWPSSALSPLSTSVSAIYAVSDEGMRALAPLTAMTDLNLSRCQRVTNERVRALSPLTALTSLNLTLCDGVTEEDVRELAHITALTDLKWSGSSTLRRR
jgi:hypothetical protein